MHQFAQNFKFKALGFVLTIVLAELTSSCAIPVSDPFEIVFTERDHLVGERTEDLRFTGKSELEVRTDFKKHEVNRLIYRRKPDRDYEDFRNLEPYTEGVPGDVWQNPFEKTASNESAESTKASENKPLLNTQEESAPADAAGSANEESSTTTETGDEENLEGE